MSEMIERVAKAIEAAGMAYLKKHGDLTDWADVPDEVFAVAAIEAMREPTEKMIDAGRTKTNWGAFGTDEVWTEMINEALK